VELTGGISIRFGTKIKSGRGAVCGASNSNANFTKDVTNGTLTLNR